MNKKANLRKIVLISLLLVAMAIAVYANSSVTIDKSVYELGEQVMISLPYNPIDDLLINHEDSSFKFYGNSSEKLVFTPINTGLYVLVFGENGTFNNVSFEVINPVQEIKKIVDGSVSIIVNGSANVTNLTIKPKVIDSSGNEIVANIKYLKRKTINVVPSAGNESSADYFTHEEVLEPELNEIYDIEVISANKPIGRMIINEVIMDENFSVGIDSLTSRSVPVDENVVDAFAINLDNINFTNATFTKTASGSELFKCAEWNFESQSCLGSWEKIMDIIPGEEYSILLYPGDPGYYESDENSWENGTFTNTAVYSNNIILLNTTSLPCIPANYVPGVSNFHSTVDNNNGTWTTTIQPNSVYGKDTWFNSGQANNDGHGSCNYVRQGTQNQVGRLRRGLYWFNISMLPIGITITQSIHRGLVIADWGGTTTSDLYRLTEDWVEGTGSCSNNNNDQTGATWDTYDGSNNWATAGGSYASPFEFSWVNPRAGEWINYTVTNLVTSWYNGTFSNYGFITIPANEGATNIQVNVNSSEAEASTRPILDITYEMICYNSEGNYTSQVFDPGSVVTWDNVTWSEILPTGTDLVIYTHTCDDDACSGEENIWDGPFTSTPTLLSGNNSRYFQYRVRLNTSYFDRTPELNWINVSYTLDIIPPIFENETINVSLINQSEHAMLNVSSYDLNNIVQFNATLKYPNGTSESIPMINYATGQYYLNITDTNQTGIYNFTNIVAIDALNYINNTAYGNLYFTVTPSPPDPFNLLSPDNRTVTVNRSPELSWEQTVENDFANYTILIDKDPNFGSPDRILFTLQIDNTSINVTPQLDADDIYYWRVSAYDIYSNVRNSTYDFVYITDNTDPDIVLNYPTSFALTSSFGFNFTPTDNNLANCSLFGDFNGTWGRNQTNLTSVSGEYNYFDITLADGVYLWNVQCYDEANSEAFRATNASFTVDTQPPAIYLEAPDNNTLNDSTNNIVFLYNVTDVGTDIDSCILIVDDVLEGVPDITITEDISQNFTAFVANGVHNWSINCTDDNGFTNRSLIYNITVNVVSESDPPIINLNFPGPDRFLSDNTVVFNYTPNDASGLENCSIFIDGMLNDTNSTANNTNPNYFTIAGISEAEHSWQIGCYDNNTFTYGTSSIQNFTIDLTNPYVSLIAPANDSFENSSTFNFNYTPFDVNLANCTLFGNFSGAFTNDLVNLTPANGTQNFFTKTLTEGTYLWNLQCFDLSGRHVFNQTNFTVKVDIDPPNFINSQIYPLTPTSYSPTQLYHFNISVNDAFLDKVWIEHNFTGTLTNYSVDINETNIYQYNFTTLNQGTYVYTWFANDSLSRVNNTDQATYNVNKASSEANLLLNGTDGNFSIVEDTSANITALMVTPSSGNVEVYLDGILFNNGSAPRENITLFSEPGTYNFTAKYISTENYSYSNETHFLIVNDTTFPFVNLTSPQNDTTVGSLTINFQYNVTDNVNLSQCRLYVNGTLVSADSDVENGLINNRIYTVGSEGNHSWFIECIDTSGNAVNATPYNVTVLEATELLINLTLDKFSYEIGSDVNATTHTADEFGGDLMSNVTTDIILGNTSYSWFNTDWKRRKTITLDGGYVNENLSDFPALIRLSSSNFNFTLAQNAGQDIRFTLINKTELDFEIENWNITSETAEIWLRIPVLQNLSNTSILMYYNNSGASSGEAAQNVWGSRFAAVWHMNSDQDSTDGNHDLSCTTCPDDNASGFIDGAYTYDDAADVHIVGSSSEIDAGTFDNKTIEVWFMANSISTGTTNDIIYEQGGGTRGLNIYASDDTLYIGGFNRQGGESNWNPGTFISTSISTQRWYYAVLRLKDGNDIFCADCFKMFLDGEEVVSGEGRRLYSHNPAQIGFGDTRTHDGTAGEATFDGTIDEVRLSNEAKSDAWINASFYSMNGTMTTIGNENVWIARNQSETDANGYWTWLWSSFNQSYANYTAVSLGQNADFADGTDAKQFEIIPDATPPNITLIDPEDDHNTTNATLIFNWTTYDVQLDSTCNLTVDGVVNVTDIFSSNYYPTNVTVNGFLEGTHYWNVTCWDSYENINTSNSRRFNIDLSGPEISLDAPVEAYNTSNTSITFNWTPSDVYSANITCQLFIDSVNQSGNLTNANNTMNNFTVSDIPAGSHFWNVTCFDELGNQNTSKTNTFVILGPPSDMNIDYYINTSVYINWSAVAEADNYSIYMTDNYTLGFGSTPDVIGITDLYYTDSTANQSYRRFYKVSAVRGDAESLNNISVGKYDRILGNSFNLISVPFDLSNYELENGTNNGFTFDLNDSCIVSLYQYSVDEGFLKTDWIADRFIPSTGSENFTYLNKSRGYWFESNSSCLLTIVGAAPYANVTTQLDQEFNLMSWHSAEMKQLPDDYEPVLLYTAPNNSIITINRLNVNSQLFELTVHYMVGETPWGWFPSFNNPNFRELKPVEGYYFNSQPASTWEHQS